MYSATKDVLKKGFKEMKSNNIENVLAMPGDIPEADFDFS